MLRGDLFILPWGDSSFDTEALERQLDESLVGEGLAGLRRGFA